MSFFFIHDFVTKNEEAVKTLEFGDVLERMENTVPSDGIVMGKRRVSNFRPFHPTTFSNPVPSVTSL